MGIVVIAALAWRVSMQIAGQPAARSSSWSQAVNEQASRPTRSSGTSILLSAAISASGSLGARISFTIRPAWSTTQIAVSSSDTSSPA